MITGSDVKDFMGMFDKRVTGSGFLEKQHLIELFLLVDAKEYTLEQRRLLEHKLSKSKNYWQKRGLEERTFVESIISAVGYTQYKERMEYQYDRMLEGAIKDAVSRKLYMHDSMYYFLPTELQVYASMLKSINNIQEVAYVRRVAYLKFRKEYLRQVEESSGVTSEERVCITSFFENLDKSFKDKEGWFKGDAVY